MTIISKKSASLIINKINNGEVVIIPTETVYGLVCRADNKAGINMIYKLKNREVKQPLQVLMSQINSLDSLIDDKLLKKKLRTFWPGPLTAILKISQLNDKINKCLVLKNTIGIRIPDNQVALKIIQASGGFLAATSANISGIEPANDPKTIDSIFNKSLYLLDDGIRNNNIPSSVINFAVVPPSVVRSGALNKEQIDHLTNINAL